MFDLKSLALILYTMEKKYIYGIIGGFALLVLIIVLMVFGTFNGFVAAEQQVDEKWANIETQFQRRVDLIPNLVATVQGVSDFESDTLVELSKLRTQWQTQPETRIETANQIESALSKLLLVAENYPVLQATQAYRDLLVQLEGTENRISFARQEYNSAVRNYNTQIKRIPGVFLANMFGFTDKEFFEAQAGADVVPDVDFS